MIDVFLKGIGVGVAVAAPVGPIGLLCIKRTLNGGRGPGLATGLGAATADALYGLVVAAGFTATGLLTRYASVMELGGGLLIAALGLLSVRAFLRAAPREAAALAPAAGLLGTFGTSFALTLSNPATIIAFVGLVAGLGASAASSPLAPYALVIGVFLGSGLWWLFLVHAALVLRTRLTPSATRWLDLASGLVLLAWGASIAVLAAR